MSSRFSQGYLSPRRRVALLESGSLSHTPPTYIASTAHYHTGTNPRAAPTMEIVDDFIEYVDPVLRPALPVLPPPILPPYHHGELKIVLDFFFEQGFK